MTAIRHLANWVTGSRFLFAVLLACVEPFSPLFWAMYLCGGISDLVDGPIARRLHQQSDAGAELDSAADFLFVLCVAIAVVRSTGIPAWALCLAGAAALARLAAYGIGYLKYHTFPALHTVLNKAAGALLFIFPVLYRLLGMDTACLITCSAALLSAGEELIITIQSENLDRNRKNLADDRDSQ